MERSSSSEADKRSSGHEIHRLSLLRSQQLATASYPTPEESNPHTPILFLYDVLSYSPRT
jgi:hypothetical protein